MHTRATSAIRSPLAAEVLPSLQPPPLIRTTPTTSSIVRPPRTSVSSTSPVLTPTSASPSLQRSQLRTTLLRQGRPHTVSSPPTHPYPPRPPSSGATATAQPLTALSRITSIARSVCFFPPDASSFLIRCSQPDPSEISIVVVGDGHCGKSTVIDKGLKKYRLSRPSTVSPRDHPNVTCCVFSFTFTHLPPVSPDELSDTVRDGFVPRDGLPDRVLHVLEVDSAVLSNVPSAEHFTWPRDAPSLDAAIVCYDVSNRDSVANVEALLRCFRDLRLPVIVFACKSDLDRHVDSHQVHSRITQLDVGLVEVSALQDSGKIQLRLAFDFVLRAITTQRTGPMSDLDIDYNPASPDVLVSPPPWEISRASTATPTAVGVSARQSQSQPGPSSSSTPRSPPPPTSPTRSRSASELNANGDRPHDLDREKSRSTVDMAARATGADGLGSVVVPQPPQPLLAESLQSVDETSEDKNESRERDGRPASWATLDELLEKLLFLAVSGDDSAFISHFLLTYRRFASPRSVVLAMQKRMRWLDTPSADPMFACFAQMRICHLLEVWIQSYPHDFAVGQAAGALNALVRSIVSKTHLLHYGSDFLPFLEGRPLVDRDAAWAMKVDESADDDHEDRYPFDDYEDDEDEDSVSRLEPPASPVGTVPQTSSRASFSPTSARERKSSLPLSAKQIMDPEAARNPLFAAPEQEMTPKLLIRELQSIAAQLERIDVDVVAQEITRIEAKLFVAIEPRHWLQHTLVAGPKDSESDPIARFLEVSYHLAEWVVSLILCHDRTRARVRQIEKVVEIAARLRYYNNYSALRAFVAAIHKVTLPGDEVMEAFKGKSAGLYKTFQSWEVLLQSVRSHRAYRMALHNTKGASIPALEVHLQDLIKAHAGNTDVHPDDRTKIHWAKFNMMGRFIQSTTEFQVKCRNSVEYQFRETREHALVRQLLMRECKMDLDMQKARMQLPSDAGDTDDRPNTVGNLGNLGRRIWERLS
ncbi:ras guanine nucleotide exchange factor domain-containing protein [Vararia minispora EC-137]|uniref:Ras guanine nucleotide exchange factor domain-containing protein n=1 Tax=Vararia minispora EC-137 TaxID=1314806 RepID=A0ACB8QNN9_9AGAM|nr:ras guanine nucleotide exchange factor domain-containing protein [Vararia minispora EC-137]